MATRRRSRFRETDGDGRKSGVARDQNKKTQEVLRYRMEPGQKERRAWVKAEETTGRGGKVLMAREYNSITLIGGEGGGRK